MSRPAGAAGFTLPELIAMMVIATVLIAVAAPRFLGSTFDSPRLYHDTVAALRYAQSTALATQRTVCATFTGTTVTLTYDSSAWSATISTTCNTNLPGPSGSAAPYTVTAQGSATFSSPPAGLKFDRLGRPYNNAGVLLSSAQTITVTGYSPTITVEAESGYVH